MITKSGSINNYVVFTSNTGTQITC